LLFFPIAAHGLGYVTVNEATNNKWNNVKRVRCPQKKSTASGEIHPILSPSRNPTMKLPAKGRSEITPTNHEKAELAEPIRLDNALNNEA